MANEFKIKKGLIVTGASGGTVVDIQGSQGQLFSVTDDLSGSIFAVSDISGVPILDINSSGLSTFDGNVNLPDNKKILLGTGNDLEIYHDGSHSYINDAGTGALKILASQFEINNAANTENIATFTQNAAVNLFYNNVLKLATTSAGVTVVGAVTITDTAGTRGINRNNSGYNLDLMGGTNNTDGAYISLSGETRGGAANSYNGRIELYSGGSGLATRADALGDLIFGTKWNGGAAQILILDSASGDAAFSNNVTASAVTATTFSGDLNGTINTVTTAVTKPNTTDDNTVATTAFVKNLIAELPAGLIYKGTWNADTNTPTLAAGGGEISEGTTTTVTADKLIDSAATFTTDGVAVGDRVRVENVNGVSYALVTSVDSQTQLTLDADIVVSTTEVYIIETPAFLEEGNYYIVSVDGATDLNGITDWKVGDWVVASSTNEWQKIDNSSVLDGQGTGQTIPLWSGSGDSNTLGDAPITVNGNDTTFAGNVIAEGSLITRSVNANVTISGDTSGNIYYNNASGEHRWRANGSSVNSMNLSSTLLTVNENATFTGTVTVADLLTVNGDGHLFLGADGETPKIDMMYVDNASGVGWDTRIFTGRTDDLPNGQSFPTSTIAGGYGTQYQANSDGAFFGIIPYAAGHYRPIINWGDDVADTPFSFQFNGSDIVTINYVGDITAPIFSGDHKGTINTATTGFTQTAGNNSTLIATTEYADAAAAAVPIGNYLPLAGGTMDASANINMNSGTLSSVDSIDFGIGQLNGVSTSNLILKSLGDITYNVDSNNNGNSSHIFQESGSELMRIRYDGNVGINTTSPVVRLHVQGNNIATRATTTAQSVLRLVRDVVDTAFPSTKDSAVDFMLSRQQTVNNNLPYTRLDIRLAGTTDSSTPSLDVMSLLHNGHVGIGTTDPTNGTLVIDSTANQIAIETGTAGDGRLNIGHFSNGTFIGTYGDDGGAADLIRFGTHSGDERMRITSGGNVGIGTDTFPTTAIGERELLVQGAIVSKPPGVNDYYSYLKSHWASDGAFELGIQGAGTNHKFITSSNYYYGTQLNFHTSDQKQMVIDTNGDVGIGTTLPKAKFDVNGHFCVDSKSHAVTNAFTTCLTVNLNNHTGCYVTLTCFGDWGSHSSAAYRGEFFLQNGANGYAEPGIILRQDDNTSNGTDQIVCQILDPTGSGNPKDFEIQIRTTATTGTTSFTGQLTYTVQGKFNSIT